MSSSTYSSAPEVEIDLIELTKRLLIQWKAVLIVCLVCSLMLPSLVHLRDVRAYKKAVSETKETISHTESADDQINSIYKSLREDDREKVRQAIWQDQMISDQKEYIQNSPLMQLDPKSVRILHLGYYISGVTDDTQRSALLTGYDSVFSSSDPLLILCNSLGGDFDPTYASEMVRVEHGAYAAADPDNSTQANTGTVFQIAVILTENAKETAVVHAIDDIIEQRNNELCKSVTKHYITRYLQDLKTSFNQDIEKKMDEESIALVNMQTRQESFIRGLSEEQKTAYESICNIRKASEAVLSAENREEALLSIAQAEPAKWKLQYAPLGFLLGMLLYAGIYAVLLVISQRISSAGSAESYLGARLIGEYYRISSTPGIRSLFTSRSLTEKLFGSKMDLEVQAISIVQSMQAICEGNNIDSLACIKISDSKVMSILVSEIYSVCKEKGVNLTWIDAAEGINELDIANVRDTVYFVDSKTSTGKISAIKQLIAEYGIESHGAVYIEEI